MLFVLSKNYEAPLLGRFTARGLRSAINILRARLRDMKVQNILSQFAARAIAVCYASPLPPPSSPLLFSRYIFIFAAYTSRVRIRALRHSHERTIDPPDLKVRPAATDLKPIHILPYRAATFRKRLYLSRARMCVAPLYPSIYLSLVTAKYYLQLRSAPKRLRGDAPRDLANSHQKFSLTHFYGSYTFTVTRVFSRV